MVQYATWTKLVHDEYKSRGGNYGTQDAVQAITRAAAQWWQQHKDEILSLAVDAARHLVSELMDEYVHDHGAFP